MKTLTIGIVGSLILGGIYLSSLELGTVKTWKGTHATTTVEVHPDWATDEEAVEAAQAVVRRKELEVDEVRLEDEIATLRTQFEAELAVVDAELKDVQLELGTY